MSLLRPYTFPTNPFIKRYDNEDFASDTNDKICTYVKEPIAVLFYDEDPNSLKLLSVFSQSAPYVTGVKMGVCHLGLETEAIQIFNFIKKMPDHPYHWVTSRKFPIILIYRHGFPMAFYDGPWVMEALVKFLNENAPDPNFHNRNIAYVEKVKADLWAEFGPTMEPSQAFRGFKAVPYHKQL